MNTRAYALLLIAGCTRSTELARPATMTSTPSGAAASSFAPADGRAVASMLDAAPDTLDATSATKSSCAKTYASVPQSACTVADAWNLQCKYPQGHCECIIAQPCAGWAGAYEEARKHPRAEWSCTARMRPDGCPGDAPANGSQCSAAGKECMYGSCGGALMACKNGTWIVDQVMSGPPEAAPQGTSGGPRD